MSGYRQSRYDPDAYAEPGPPLRPFNWVQWLGVAFSFAGLAIYLVYFAGKLGWIPTAIDATSPALGLTLAGVALVNSRRHPATDLAPELASARKRWTLITLAVCAVILGAAAAIELTGA